MAYSVSGTNPTFNLFSKIITGINPTNCSRSLRVCVHVDKGPENRIFRICRNAILGELATENLLGERVRTVRCTVKYEALVRWKAMVGINLNARSVRYFCCEKSVENPCLTRVVFGHIFDLGL